MIPVQPPASSPKWASKSFGGRSVPLAGPCDPLICMSVGQSPHAKSFAFHSAYKFGSPLCSIGVGCLLDCRFQSNLSATHHTLHGFVKLTLKPSYQFHGLALLYREHLGERLEYRFRRCHGCC